MLVQIKAGFPTVLTPFYILEEAKKINDHEIKKQRNCDGFFEFGTGTTC
jgi:hypothetical protein